MGRRSLAYVQGVELKLSDRSIPVPGEERGFRHVVNDAGDRLLVVPGKVQKMRASEWPVEERSFRSLMLNPKTGQVLSAGFPKFFNHGEVEDDTLTLDEALAAEEPVYFTDKLDGTLIIRSVIDGQVHLRTRGRLDGGEHGALAERVIAERYPILADPAFGGGVSLLFELVSPAFRIVLPYKEDNLVLVGAVDLETLRLWDVPELQELARERGFAIAEMIELPREPEALVKAVGEWQGREGVVASCNGGQTLVKIKAADYLTRHRLRFALSARVIREVCLERDVRSLADFEEFLHEQGADWELVSDSKPLVDAFLDARASAEATFEQLKAEVTEKAREFPERKDFAVKYAVPLGGARTPAAFSLLGGNEEQAFGLLLDRALDDAFAELEERDDLFDEELAEA